jgi:hypothetical protein
MLPVCHSLWTGEKLPPLLASCLESFLRKGHRVVLHAYQNLQDLPRAIEVRDAARILPFEAVGSHSWRGELPAFADRFRYELLERVDGLWIDSDMICIRPIDLTEPYLFGYESATQIGNAVLRLPAGSAVLQHLRALFPGTGFIPPWFGPIRRSRYRIKRLCGVHRDISTLPHGSTGPSALTWYAGAEGHARYAQPTDVFYPLHYRQCTRALDPAFELASVITPRTRCVHLWHDTLRSTDPRPGSLVARMLTRDFAALDV